VAEAEKKLSGGKGFLSGLFGGASKQDEALECYGRAANMYKMAKKWSAAGNTFCTIANHHIKFGNKHDAATNFVDAANCYKKNDPKEAAASLQKAIDIYTDMGRFTIAAKHHETIAGIFESEVDVCIQLQFQIKITKLFSKQFFSVLTLTKQCSTTSRWKESIGLVILTPCESGC